MLKQLPLEIFAIVFFQSLSYSHGTYMIEQTSKLRIQLKNKISIKNL